MKRAYYSAPSEIFAAEDPKTVLGSLTAELPFAVEPAQRDAWQTEIYLLQQLSGSLSNAHIFLEFTIPRMGRRADCVVLWRGVVFVLEYKVGAADYSASALDQTLGYGLDLKHFHETSHSLPIVPILVATEARRQPQTLVWGAEDVAEPIRATSADLLETMRTCASVARPEIDAKSWEAGRYRPTPTIIQAAQALYVGHSVEDISRSEAGAENLTATASYIDSVIEAAKRDHRKAVCFVTGVPGSGKTLAGLNLATRRMRGHDEEHAVFLSGNGPLVKVLRAALARDAVERAELAGLQTTHAQELGKASAFIQNIHHFRDEALGTSEPLTGKVVVFDEAQRAWDIEQTAKFMRVKRGQRDFGQSEPEFLLSVMDRNQDWCVVVCLVGGGQEINTGEAGLTAWLDALSTRFVSWDVHFASQLLGAEYGPGGSETHTAVQRARRASHLHLSVSVRSYRAERVSEFVGAILDGNPDRAREIGEHLEHYSIHIVRDLTQARGWLRSKRRGVERAGLLASSNALRLKPDGVFVRAKIDPEDWFLAPRGDVRGSDALEDVGTEFDVQGLELDWACVCWDANWRRSRGTWEGWRFSGSSWKRVLHPARRSFLMNSYRVLMTRARQGFVVFVPRGDTGDPTRDPAIYDSIADYLSECGMSVMSDSEHSKVTG